MNEDQVCKANNLFDSGLTSELYEFIKPFLKVNDPIAMYFYSCVSLSEWNESDEDFDRRNIELLEKSASAGFAPAMYRLSALYFTGDKGKIDVVAGKRLLDEAFEMGYGPAKLTIGINTYYGVNGYSKSIEKALALISNAKEDGVEGANLVYERIQSA